MKVKKEMVGLDQLENRMEQQDGTTGWNNRENERVEESGQGEEGIAGNDILSEVNKEDELKCEGKSGQNLGDWVTGICNRNM